MKAVRGKLGEMEADTAKGEKAGCLPECFVDVK